MKYIVSILTLIVSIIQVSGQTPTLSKPEVQEIFNDSVRSALKIDYKIFRVYTYTDKAGEHFVALTEKIDSITPTKDTLHYKIKAISFVKGVNGLEKQWEINDFISQENDENSIWFWTKYCDFKDLDNDGVVDPILVYGSNGINGYADGRVKIILFYKGKKIAIRHQNGVLDFQRNTQVDQTFYSLELSMQDRIKEIIQKLIDDNHAVFPYGWQDAMKKQKLKIEQSN